MQTIAPATLFANSRPMDFLNTKPFAVSKEMMQVPMYWGVLLLVE